MDTHVNVALYVAAALATAGWLVLLAARAIATSPRLGAALPATMDIGPEPPAVAAFLVNRWRLAPDGIAATLLDLAGRNLVDIEQIAPQKYILRPQLREIDGSLTDYERRVLDHVKGKCRDGVVPAAALDLGTGARAKQWTAGFDKEVIADAKARGLSRNRWNATETVLLVGSAAVPPALLGVAVHQMTRDANGDSPGVGVFVFGWLILFALFRSLRSQRDTPAGRAAASRWLGLRDYLGQNPAFPTTSPAAEAIWDRYLAYAAAFGFARTAVRALPIRAEDPNSAWTAYGGRWRLVRLRWPGAFWRPGTRMQPVAAAAIGFALAAFGGAIVWKLGRYVDVETVRSIRRDVVRKGWQPETLLGAAWIVGGNVMIGYVLLQGSLLLVRAIPDLLGREEVVGEVLRVRSITNDDSTTWYLVMDDGRSSRLDVWQVRPDIASAAKEGRVMRATIARRLGYVYALGPPG